MFEVLKQLLDLVLGGAGRLEKLRGDRRRRRCLQGLIMIHLRTREVVQTGDEILQGLYYLANGTPSFLSRGLLSRLQTQKVNVERLGREVRQISDLLTLLDPDVSSDLMAALDGKARGLSFLCSTLSEGGLVFQESEVEAIANLSWAEGQLPWSEPGETPDRTLLLRAAGEVSGMELVFVDVLGDLGGEAEAGLSQYLTSGKAKERLDMLRQAATRLAEIVREHASLDDFLAAAEGAGVSVSERMGYGSGG